LFCRTSVYNVANDYIIINANGREVSIPAFYITTASDEATEVGIMNIEYGTNWFMIAGMVLACKNVYDDSESGKS
jgi:hypothetical protein